MTDRGADSSGPELMESVNRANLRRSLYVIFSDVRRTVRILVSRPSLIPAGIRLHLHQKRAADLRRNACRNGHDIPVMMFISITSQCNLSCTGCYMRQRGRRTEPELSAGELHAIIAQAQDLGIAVIGIVGGEPLLRRQVVTALARSFPRILFTLSTNGLLIDEAAADELSACENLIPLISIDGLQRTTDSRRGEGTFNRVLNASALLKPRIPFFGCAVTVSRENFSEVLDDRFVTTMLEAGARAFIFIQYVPAEPGTGDLALDEGHRSLLVAKVAEFGGLYPAFFLAVPGNMEPFGGCLSGGRGFIHVSPYGDLEPCPLVAVSDANLRSVPLREALESPLLKGIRKNHRSLRADGKCVLRTDPRWPETTGLRK